MPSELDLLDLVLVTPRPHYVIINGPPTVVESEQSEPITFTSGESYVRLPINESLQSVEFYFRTVEPNGLLFYTGNKASSGAIGVETFDGQLYIIVDVDNEPTRKYLLEVPESASGRVDDGQPHRVRMNFGRGGYLRLRLDDSEERIERVFGFDRIANLFTDLFVGGVDYADRLPWHVWTREGRGKFYKGCMWGIRVNGGRVYDLARIVGRQRGIEVGCEAMPTDCRATGPGAPPCVNGAPCRQFWAGHSCDCSETRFTGQTCGQGQSS